MQLAEKARENAYAPYSHFRVGAAILCTNGKVYTGCNVENVSYGGTVCAERTAMLKAISEAEREFTAIAITGAKEGEKGGFCGRMVSAPALLSGMRQKVGKEKIPSGR